MISTLCLYSAHSYMLLSYYALVIVRANTPCLLCSASSETKYLRCSDSVFAYELQHSGSVIGFWTGGRGSYPPKITQLDVFSSHKPLAARAQRRLPCIGPIQLPTPKRNLHSVKKQSKLENVHWISIPVHIGDPIGVAYGGATWRVNV